MTTLLFHLWTRHSLRPGVFWSLSKGERLLLRAFAEKELEMNASSASSSSGRVPRGERR
ncbi:hypothetical protein FHR92_004106 [Fontibacillus solani]|uniref:Uncharacterized protein n=1 Tax=Fontibacillus solani TaxID=1572857 RepID=A0A7W3XTI0_9BACL|nr:hypothetical protein [Fontibacillus solani]